MSSVRQRQRQLLLALNYLHPAAVGVAMRRGPVNLKHYLAEIYRCSKTDAGAYLPVAPVEQFVTGSTLFQVERGDWDGSMTLAEITSLCYLVAARRPSKVLEIGTFRGLTTLNLALNAPNAEIHTLDLPPDTDPTTTAFATKDDAIIGRRGGYLYERYEGTARITQHYGDSATFDFTPVGDAVDICLIDAAHSYDYVRSDTWRTLPLVADGGLMLWHDYGRNDFMSGADDAWGVTQLLHEIAGCGVQILAGTSIGALEITPRTRSMLSRLLAVSA